VRVGPHCGYCQVKDLGDRRPDGAAVASVHAGDVVRRDACLPVGGARQRHGAGLVRHQVQDLHRVPHGVDRRIGGLHMLVDKDVSARTEGQTGLRGECALGADAKSQDDQIRMEFLILSGAQNQAAVGILFD